MKRKVAGGMSGNFRRVCPILNRATVIPNTVCAKFLGDILSLQRYMNAVVSFFQSEPLKTVSEFFMIRQGTHGRV